MWCLRKQLRFLQRFTQCNQLARAHLAQRRACGDAFHVAHTLQFSTQRLPGHGAAQRIVAAQYIDGTQAGHGFSPVALGLEQPALEQAAAHAGHAGVQ